MFCSALAILFVLGAFIEYGLTGDAQYSMLRPGGLAGVLIYIGLVFGLVPYGLLNVVKGTPEGVWKGIVAGQCVAVCLSYWFVVVPYLSGFPNLPAFYLLDGIGVPKAVEGSEGEFYSLSFSRTWPSACRF